LAAFDPLRPSRNRKRDLASRNQSCYVTPVKRLVAILAISVAVSPPLWAQAAAPPSDGPLTCLLEGMSAEQRALAGSAASQLLGDVPPGDGEQRDPTMLNGVLPSLTRCAEAGRWNEAQRERAREWALVRLAREDMQRRYAAQNVDLTFIDEALAATPAESPAPFDALVTRMRAQGVADDRPDSAADIVYIYLMLRAHAEEIRAEFAGPNPQPR
jgi:hypothetical protein